MSRARAYASNAAKQLAYRQRKRRNLLDETPHEQIGDCTLYLGDCRTILPLLGPVDVLITDPPYGTGWLKGGGPRAGVFHAQRQQAAWDCWSMAWLPLVRAQTFAVFCPDSHLAELLRYGGGRLRYYIKSNPRPGMQGVDAPSAEPIVIWPRVRFSHGPAHCVAYNGDSLHPCGKPLRVMQWLVQDVSAPGETVLDCFMGLGPTGVACVQLGRRFIGIERDPVYFRLACQGIEAAARQGQLFAPAVTATQAALL
jgi:DNA modification methylase